MGSGSGLKICVVSHAYPRFNGDWNANFVEELALSYGKLGEVTIFVPFERSRTKLALPASHRLVQFRYLPLRRWHTVGSESLMKQDMRPRLGYLLHMALIMIIGTIQLAFLLRRQRYDVVHAHWGVPAGLMAVVARVLAGSPAQVFSSFPGSDVSILRGLKKAGRPFAWLLQRSDLLACNSRDLREDLERVGIKKPIELIIYGVNATAVQRSSALRRQIRAKLGLSDHETALLMVGRFVPKKGFATGIRAMGEALKQNPSLRLFLIGQGDDLRADFERIILDYGMQAQVAFLGNVAKADLPAYYSAADIFLMPSERLPSDGLNVVVPEAMACGLPILASEVGGNDLVVEPGLNGYLHRAGDAHQLAEHILALSANHQERVRMGKASQKLVEEKFNWDAIAQQYLGHLAGGTKGISRGGAH